MNLETFKFPEVRTVDKAFPTFKTIPELLEEAKRREKESGLNQGKKIFNLLFFGDDKVSKIKIKSDVAGTWKEKALSYAGSFMGSWEPKHEHKELVCAMLLEECMEMN